MADAPTCLTLRQLADRLSVSPKVLYGLRYRGDGPPALRVGRELRFRLVDVEAWEQSHLEQPKGAA
jgi:predicted DNA-binding transcriptional regulator AlpA